MSQIFLNNPVWVKSFWITRYESNTNRYGCSAIFTFSDDWKLEKNWLKPWTKSHLWCAVLRRGRGIALINTHTRTKLMWNHCQRFAWLRNANVALRDTLSRIYQKGSSHSKHQTVSRYTRKSNFMLGSTKCVLPAPTFATNTKVQQYYMHMPKKHNLNQIGQ